MSRKHIGAFVFSLALLAGATFAFPTPAQAGWFSDMSCSLTGIGCPNSNPPFVYCGVEYTGTVAMGMRMLASQLPPCPGPTVNNTPPATTPSPTSESSSTTGSATTTGTTGSGSGTDSSGSDYTACSSVANVCGMTTLGNIVNGACSAAAPANSQCPLPEISFSASPARVQSGQTTTLNWSATAAVSCALSGGGLSLSGLPLSGSRETGPITGSTPFTLTCSNGPDGSQQSAQVQVTVIPVYQEI